MPRHRAVLVTFLLFATLVISLPQSTSPLPVSSKTLSLSSNGSASFSPPAAVVTSRPVRWQTAYWSLVALALNAMTQASGADIHLAAATLSPARSSPIVCAADVIVLLIWTGRGLWRGLGLRRSLGLAEHYTTTDTTEISKNPTSETEGSDEKDDLKNGIPIAGLMFFFLAPLPQFVKLCGMKRVPITQTLGTIYMAVYLLSVVASVCPKPESSTDTVATPMEEADTLKASDIRGLRKLSSTIYTLAIILQIVVWIVLILALAIIVINPGGGYLFGLLAPLVFALGGCLTRNFCWSFVAWFYTFVFLFTQLAASKEGPSILETPKDGFAWILFQFYRWFGSILLMCATVLVAVFGCWYLLALLEAGIKSLRNFSGETRAGRLEIYHPFTERQGMNTTAQSAQILTSASHVRAQSTGSTTDTPEGPSSSTMQDQNDVEPPLGRPDSLAPPSQVATPEVHPSQSAVQQEQSLNFEKRLEDKTHTVGEIGESPAHPRPYGFHPANRLGIERAKAKGVPYWAASVGGPATSPATGTIYLNAEQIKIVKERLQFKQMELLSPLREAEEKAKSSANFSVAFAIANLVIGLLCYIYKYDVEGTFKPDRTGLLG